MLLKISIPSTNKVAVNISTDGGVTWKERQWLGTTQDAFNAPGSGLLPFDDKPSVTADPNIKENAYVVRERFDSVFGPTFDHSLTLFNRTLNSGLIWSDFTVIYDPGLDTSISPLIGKSTFNNTIVVLPDDHIKPKGLRGNLLNFFNRTSVDTSAQGFFDIAFIRSTDLGENWDANATIVVPPVQAFPNGVPLVFTGGYTYDGGGNITGGIGTLMRTGAFANPPSITFAVAVSPKKGYLYVVFPTTQFRADFLPQVGLTVSRDGGTTWSTPVLINRTPQDAPNPQAFSPSIAITHGGDVAVLYSDFRLDDKQDPNITKTKTWVAIYKEVKSSSGGSTGVGLDFVQEVGLGKSYIAQNGPVTPSGTMTTGDYPFIVANHSTFFAIFTRSHNGPFTPPVPFFTDGTNTLFIDDNYRQSPYVSIIERK